MSPLSSCFSEVFPLLFDFCLRFSCLFFSCFPCFIFQFWSSLSHMWESHLAIVCLCLCWCEEFSFDWTHGPAFGDHTEGKRHWSSYWADKQAAVSRMVWWNACHLHPHSWPSLFLSLLCLLLSQLIPRFITELVLFFLLPSRYRRTCLRAFMFISMVRDLFFLHTPSF